MPAHNPFSADPRLNRAQRRQFLSHVSRKARFAARSAYDYTPDGKLTKITHPVAVARLEKSYVKFVEQMERFGAPVPFIVPLDEDVAQAFPHYDAKDNPPGSRPWLAVSLDMDGRFTHVVQHIVPLGRGETLDNAFAAMILIRSLEAQSERSVFPNGEPEETC